MNANELRRAFTEFFAERDHLPIPSASLIPHDNTLLFTNSGMVPFKPYFVGEEPPPAARAVSIQKCVRAGGKHNDLDEVGRTQRHLTFFEMMGNFSFGDYFKEQAIPMAWEFVTETLGLDPERLWVTVHLTDDEAEEIWATKVGVPMERIQRLDEDNWWRMADTGPNGPCSEIFWDKGPKYGPAGGPENPDAEDRYVEIWNLVFMQFATDESGESHPLPKPSIDTGAGLERILSVLQEKDSVFDIDEMVMLVETASEITGYQLGADDDSDLALRVLAEHARTMTFLISDGVLPSNEDRGYVLRRIMRRAVRFAHLLGVTDLVTPRLVDRVIEIMGADYPELVDNHSLIRSTVEREEKQFRRTLATGLAKLQELIEPYAAGDQVPGAVAFVLHDTHGFPLEVTEEVLKDYGMTVDHEGFDTEMAAQRQRAKAGGKFAMGEGSTVDYPAVVAEHGATEFVGRDTFAIDGTVLVATDEGIVVDRTPFYAESGGQVGDTGTISWPNGHIDVTDTVAGAPGLNLHRVADGSQLPDPGTTVTLEIDVDRRNAIRRNHTATHLVHYALRAVLGEHVKQQGSEVGPDRLRFDFSHHDGMTAEEIAQVEDLVMVEILANLGARHIETTMDEAKKMGAIAFFGDKYGDIVRVLEAGPNSTELCGGTHVRALGDIGAFKIVSEGSVGSGVRRIEAVTGAAPVVRLREQETRLAAIASQLGVADEDIADGLDRRLAELKGLRKELDQIHKDATLSNVDDFVAHATNGVVVERVDGLESDDVRDLAVALRDKPEIRCAVLASATDGGGVALVAACTPDSGLDAGDLLSGAFKHIGGGGGRNPELCVAGGKNPAGIDEALAVVRAAAGI